MSGVLPGQQGAHPARIKNRRVGRPSYRSHFIQYFTDLLEKLLEPEGLVDEPSCA